MQTGEMGQLESAVDAIIEQRDTLLRQNAALVAALESLSHDVFRGTREMQSVARAALAKAGAA